MRTPLLRELATLARHASESLATSRRGFLGAVGAGAAATALGACDNAPSPSAPVFETPRAARGGSGENVVVIGAGLAGLMCAYRLRQQGIVATVYEANTRIGGRCWTNRKTFVEGQIAEHGGELIDQSHTTIRQLAQELGLPLDNVLAAEPNGSEAFFWFNGGRYSYEQALTDMKPVWQSLKRDYVEAGYPTLYTRSTARGRALDATSVRAWIQTNVPGGIASPLGEMLDVAYCIEYGAETTDQSALNLIYLMGAVGQGQLRLFGPSNEKYKVRGGNDQLVSGMAASLHGQIVTGKALTALRANGSGWTLDFDDRTSVNADRVVLALPFSVLRERVSLKGAAFPLQKVRAIAELGMGRNAKLALQFSSRHWNSLGNGGDTFADTGYQATWDVTRAQPGTKGILVNYTGGAVTDSQSGRMPAMLATQFLTRVEPVLPGLTSRYTGVVSFDDWPRNPWSLGSYSYYRVGQYQRFGGAESEIVGSCHFAGEHTSTDAQGYLEGGVESGARAASEVLAAVSGK
ncbi:MAG: NAD(P)/FAD-dependent oxidoreductase [Gemmatimonadota bacterium]